MNFDLTPDQKLLAETVKAFTKQRSPVERFRKLRGAGEAWEPEVWAHMGELGWLSVPFAEEVGGFGAGFVEVALILEGLGRTLVPEPYLASVVLGGMALARAGTPAQQERWLTPMIEGQSVLALAYAERGSRYQADAPATVAERSGEGWTLRGRKDAVLGGMRAGSLVVSAQTPDGLGLFVVDADAAGLRRRAIRTIDGHGAAQLELEGVAVGEEHRLGEPGHAAQEALAYVLDCGAAAACAEGLGVGQAAFDMTCAHLKEREQFGVPIGAFQALQHRAVDMFVELELVRSMSVMASIEVDNPEPAARRRAVSAAKAKLSTGGRFITQQAIQLHGGIGITDEHDIGLYFKRMLVLNAILGDEQHHLERMMGLPGFAA